MILVDSNILIYAHVTSSPQHQIASDWLDRQLSGTTQVGLPWTCLLAFVRVVTHPRIYKPPEPMADAWRQVREWLSSESAWIPQPGERYADFLGEFLTLPGVQGNLVTDAYLAALAAEHGLTLCSADSDFARFPRLDWMNPLVK
jgi:toxin-antitoxin system PIN domain toxin